MHIFTKKTLSWYKNYGRVLPWRQTTDSYKILVSEFMLQQTQVLRVIPKYEAFLEQFPTVTDLANASLSDVLSLWVGLGYNRRAKYLYNAAKDIVQKYNRNIPDSVDELQKIQGIGPYVAGAICAFAYNKPVIVIDANITRVYNRVFGLDKKEIPDKILQTLPQKKARDFYNALMDIGSQYYKSTSDYTTYPYKDFCCWFNGKQIPALKTYKQSQFTDSNRYYRGQILKQLVEHKILDFNQIQNDADSEKYLSAVSQLVDEGLIIHDSQKIYLKK